MIARSIAVRESEEVRMMQVKPELEDQVQDFKRKYFRPFTVGLQIRYSGRSDTLLTCPALHHIGSVPAASLLDCPLPTRTLQRTRTWPALSVVSRAGL